MRDSINVWFAHLALRVDGRRARAFDKAMDTTGRNGAGPPSPDLALVQCSRILGFGETPLDLAVNLPKGITLRRRRFKSGLWEGDVLYAHPGRLDLMGHRERGLSWVLAQSAIGQGMTASPLEMARVAAAIATGKIPHPFIFRRLGERELRPPRTKEMELEAKELGLLREAMHTVPDTGTARSAFLNHPQLCRIYAKTGTANVGVRKKGKIVPEKRFHTTWFIGWREPKKGGRRLAFACMVTHSHGRGSNTGRQVCAPIIAEILEGI
jgi:cell division protein FtsI/penicillin-binding protein 2